MFLLGRAFEATVRSKSLFEHASNTLCTRNHCSEKLCSVTLHSATLHSARMLRIHCALEITVQKRCALLHGTLLHFTLLHFTPCMDMHGFTLVYIYIEREREREREREKEREREMVRSLRFRVYGGPPRAAPKVDPGWGPVGSLTPSASLRAYVQWAP